MKLWWENVSQEEDGRLEEVEAAAASSRPELMQHNGTN
jgi:hypothetical protein